MRRQLLTGLENFNANKTTLDIKVQVNLPFYLSRIATVCESEGSLIVIGF